MLAKGTNKYSIDCEVIEADAVIKRVINNAEYYEKQGNHTMTLVPSDKEKARYVVDGKYYDVIYTNGYEELARWDAKC